MKSLGSIFAVGMRTPMGLGAVDTAFLLRTGIPSLAAAPLADPDGNPVTMAFDRTLDPYLTGPERSARLASSAFAEIAARIGATRARSLRLRVALALPEARPGLRDQNADVLLATSLRDALHETFGAPEVEVANRGSAGLAYVLPAALAALGRGEIDAVLAGGVHSDYDPLVIASLAAQGRLFSGENADAVVPGEGAAFILVARDDFGARLGTAPLARLHSVASEMSDVSVDDVGRAFESSAMAHVITDATQLLAKDTQIGWAVTDTGLEHARIRELYAAVTRTHGRFGPPLVVDSPAQRMGHLGAASMGLALGFMAIALERGFAPCPLGLALGASDGGERAAMLLGSA